MLDQPDDRDEPFFMAHPTERGLMAWWDHRSYTLTPETGGVRL